MFGYVTINVKYYILGQIFHKKLSVWLILLNSGRFRLTEVCRICHRAMPETNFLWKVGKKSTLLAVEAKEFHSLKKSIRAKISDIWFLRWAKLQ